MERAKKYMFDLIQDSIQIRIITPDSIQDSQADPQVPTLTRPNSFELKAFIISILCQPNRVNGGDNILFWLCVCVSVSV